VGGGSCLAFQTVDGRGLSCLDFRVVQCYLSRDGRVAMRPLMVRAKRGLDEDKVCDEDRGSLPRIPSK
jgi:hypothetical protein